MENWKYSINSQLKGPYPYDRRFVLSAGHAMEWNGTENGMEWKENFGMEYGRCSEWNEMEDLKNRMEDHLPYFHTNYIQYISNFKNKLRSTTKLE